MANLKSIANDLHAITAASKEATGSLEQLKMQLIEVLRAGAKGGTPTEAGLAGAAERIIAGTAGNRVRLGGGAYYGGSKAQQEALTETMNLGLIRATEEQGFEKLKAETEQTIAKRIARQQEISGKEERGAVEVESWVTRRNRMLIEAETKRMVEEQRAEQQRSAAEQQRLAAIEGRTITGGGIPEIPVEKKLPSQDEIVKAQEESYQKLKEQFRVLTATPKPSDAPVPWPQRVDYQKQTQAEITLVEQHANSELLEIISSGHTDRVTREKRLQQRIAELETEQASKLALEEQNRKRIFNDQKLVADVQALHTPRTFNLNEATFENLGGNERLEQERQTQDELAAIQRRADLEIVQIMQKGVSDRVERERKLQEEIAAVNRYIGRPTTLPPPSQGTTPAGPPTFTQAPRPAEFNTESDFSITHNYAAVNNLIKPLNLQPEQIKKVNEYFKEFVLNLEKGGNTLNYLRGGLDTTDDGFTKLSMRFRDSTGNIQNLVLYTGELATELGKLPVVLTETAKGLYEVSSASSKTKKELPKRQDVETSIGNFRAGRAYSLAGQHGFGPDTLQQVKIEQPANTAQLTFAMQNAQGITEKLTVDIDQYGHALTRTNRRLLNFTDSLVHNTIEMFKWSIGAMFIYGAYSKIGQIVQTAIENQTKLADVTIALGNAQRDTNAIFEDAAVIANQTGESINGVLQSYTMAYRAVGAISDPIKRTAAANKLLTDSTILNKLSDLDAAEAIDVLSGSLRQAKDFMTGTASSIQRYGSELANGTELLDKWVKVTQVANVDLATLSTAFSVTAESALNAGVSIEQLNAIIASLSEKIGGLGGKETGNAVRALIGGVYQQQAASALNQYGIAVQDVDGRMRDFLTISRDIYELYEQGIIDDTQLNKLGYTLGGGVRRGQQYVAFLKDQARIQEIVNEQQGASGTAQAALALKTDTLQTATTRLGNAFQRLAQSLGTNGGILDVMTLGTEKTTDFVDVLRSLTDILGRVTVPAAMLTLLGAYSALSTPNRLKTGAFLDTLGAPVGNLFAQIANPPKNWGKTTTRYTSAGPTQEQMLSPLAIRSGEFGKGITPGLIMGMFPAMSKLGEGDARGAAISFGTSVAGAIAGYLIGGPVGSMIGSTIGAFIADVFTKDVLDKQAEFRALFAESQKVPLSPGNKPLTGWAGINQPGYGITPQDAQSALQTDAVNRMYKLLGGYGITNITAKLQGMSTPEFAVKELTRVSQYKNGTPGSSYQNQIDQATQILKDLGIIGNQNVPKEVELSDTQFYKTMDDLRKQQVDGQQTTVEYIDAIAEAYRQELADKQRSGEINPRQRVTGVQSSYTLSPSTLSLGTALTMAGGMGEFGKTAGEQWTTLSNIIKKSSAEDIGMINSVIGQIRDLTKWMEENKDVTNPANFMGAPMNMDRAKEQMEQYYKEAIDLAHALQIANEKAMLQDFHPYNVINAVGQDPDQIFKKAQELQTRDMGQQMLAGAITQEQLDAAIQNAQPILINTGDQMAYFIAKGIIDSKYIEQAIQQQSQVGYQFMDVTKAQFDAIMPQYNAIAQQITQAGGTVNEEPLVTFFKDSTNPMLMKADWRIVQYLLQEILKTEEKQLDGIYNLPSGASFYVPFQAWAMDKQTREASGTGDNFPSDQWDQAAYEQYASALHITTAVQTFQEAVNYWWDLLNRGVVKEGDVPKDILSVLKAQIARGELKQPVGSSPESYVVNEQIYGIKRPYDPRRPPEQTTVPQAWIDWANQFMNSLNQASGYDPNDAGKYKIEAQDTSKLQPLGGSSTSSTGNTGMWEPLITALRDMFNQLMHGVPVQPNGTQMPNSLTGGLPSVNPGLPNSSIATPPIRVEIPQVQSNLSINLQAQTQLIVDGRTLADVIKPYLYNDMITSENTAGSTGTYVAA